MCLFNSTPRTTNWMRSAFSARDIISGLPARSRSSSPPKAQTRHSVWFGGYSQRRSAIRAWHAFVLRADCALKQRVQSVSDYAIDYEGAAGVRNLAEKQLAPSVSID